MPARAKQNWKRKLFALSRLIHIYTSTLLLGLLVFFCVTGITLNHRWYGESSTAETQEYELSATLLESWGVFAGKPWSPNINAISEYFHNEFKFPSPHSINVEQDYGELALEFKVPAGFASVFIDASTHSMLIELDTGSTLGLLNDLHKGRHSGTAWFWLIDVSAVLMSLFAATGMIILFQGKKHRSSGLVLAALGFVTPVLIYFLLVPSVS